MRAVDWSVDQLADWLSHQRRSVTVKQNSRIVGAVEDRPGVADDRRVRWLWWCEVSDRVLEV